tara:strand:- start:15391 stop:16116 length:726 start_codon:yes stop_codon:yes gene_type:complete
MLESQIHIDHVFHAVDNFETVDDIFEKIKNDELNCINFYWLGVRDYNQIWHLQKKIHRLNLEKKVGDVVLLLEHNHVYTLGKNANKNHILQSNHNIETVNIDRGGDVTYHGPGQLVGYPIIDLHNYKMSISWYLNVISKSIIDLLLNLDIKSEYRNDYVGIWVDDSKIAAIGVRLSRWITMHGFALNINTDLSYYGGLIPCGIFECGVTSIKEILQNEYSVQEIAENYSKYFIKHLNEEIR